MESLILEIPQMDKNLWRTAHAELESAALVTVEQLQNINFAFLRLFPTLVPYPATQLPAERRAKLETRYW